MADVLILCPTFDHAETLLASTASVRAQKFRDWELVVIGDGAPERTAEIMAAIGLADRRIRYEQHPKSARFGYASASGQGRSLGRATPMIETGSIHGGRSVSRTNARFCIHF